MSYRSGLQMFAIMTNWKTEFHKPLTRLKLERQDNLDFSAMKKSSRI